SFERIGMPEGRFPLAQAALYLATAPKSNTTFSFFDALTAVEKEQEADVPNHLKDGNRDKEGFGHGKGYLYPHAYTDHWVAQQYLPETLQGNMFYEPSDQGYEQTIREQVERRREAQLAAMLEVGDRHLEIAEVLSTSPTDRKKDAWLQRTIAGNGQALGQIRDKLFERAVVQRHHLLLDLEAGTGLLTWEAVRKAPEGGVWALSSDQKNGEALREQANRLSEIERPTILLGALDELTYLLTLRGEEDIRFDRVLGRNLFTRSRETATAVSALVLGQLNENGRFCLAQTIPQQSQRLYNLVDWKGQPDALLQKVKAAEETIYSDPTDDLVNWNGETLVELIQSTGFASVEIDYLIDKQSRYIQKAQLQRWFEDNEGTNGRLSYKARLAQQGMSGEELTAVERLYRQQLQEQTVLWQTTTGIIISKTS
ncbi:MAG: AAA family ATPase, partial [Chloroflexota bacterium]